MASRSGVGFWEEDIILYSLDLDIAYTSNIDVLMRVLPGMISISVYP